MKPKAFFFPGKQGDALLQWPVAYQILHDRNEQGEVWLDSGSCKSLVKLFEAQPCVSAVKLVGPSQNYSCGGQPWQGTFTTEDHVTYEIIPMGFRSFPQRQITLQTALDVPFEIDTDRLATESSLVIPDPIKANRVVVHGGFKTHQTGTPRVWRFFRDVRGELEKRFDEIVFVGTADERSRALELYPAYKDFDDHGEFLELARLIAGSSLVIGCGSSNAALASVLHVPCIRVHDLIGEFPRIIWSGLGANQWNETDAALRRMWPEILKELTPEPTEVLSG